jgi:TRAP-type mannitol/chloroaromatic compound transport system substrate-binding protein
MDAWIKFMGGQALWDELAGEFGLKSPVRQHRRADGRLVQQGNQLADDLKGLKMRIPGLGGDVMAKLGASPVSLPGGQIYENLVSGAIDATEWVGPWNDYFMKFYEAAKYYYYPGMHEPAETIAHSDLAKRTHESFAAARADVGGWMKLSDTAYLLQRNRVLGL